MSSVLIVPPPPTNTKLTEWSQEAVSLQSGHSHICSVAGSSTQCNVCILIVTVTCWLWDLSLQSADEAYCSFSLPHSLFIHSVDVALFSHFRSSSPRICPWQSSWCPTCLILVHYVYELFHTWRATHCRELLQFPFPLLLTKIIGKRSAYSEPVLSKDTHVQYMRADAGIRQAV